MNRVSLASFPDLPAPCVLASEVSERKAAFCTASNKSWVEAWERG